MAADDGDKDLPVQHAEEMFSILIHAKSTNLGPRLARWTLPQRTAIETPHYLAITSRGAVPHLSQDTFARDTSIHGVYIALEDFIERAPQRVPPLYQFSPADGSSPLRRFIALPDQAICVLGARRAAPVSAPAANPNTNTAVSVSTAVGFRSLYAADYAEKAESLQADIVIGLGDIPYGRALGPKRVEKATDRTLEWLQGHVAVREGIAETAQAQLFAPLLPVSCARQQFYTERLTQDLEGHISGLAIYGLDVLEDLPHALAHLPRLACTTPETPHEVLRQIALGIDVFTIPFISAATDAGIALSFTFGTSSEDTAPDVTGEATDAIPLGIDMWLSAHEVDLSPLTPGCTCYTCTDHHRAYIQHLLNAKEMTGWLLLQIHNHHIMDLFFAAVRASIVDGSFNDATREFERIYESKLPEKTGLGPRVRGYERRSTKASEAKQNSAAWTMLDDGMEKNAESTPAEPEMNASQLELQGFARDQR